MESRTQPTILKNLGLQLLQAKLVFYDAATEAALLICRGNYIEAKHHREDTVLILAKSTRYGVSTLVKKLQQHSIDNIKISKHYNDIYIRFSSSDLQTNYSTLIKLLSELTGVPFFHTPVEQLQYLEAAQRKKTLEIAAEREKIVNFKLSIFVPGAMAPDNKDFQFLASRVRRWSDKYFSNAIFIQNRTNLNFTISATISDQAKVLADVNQYLTKEKLYYYHYDITPARTANDKSARVPLLLSPFSPINKIPANIEFCITTHHDSVRQEFAAPFLIDYAGKEEVCHTPLDPGPIVSIFAPQKPALQAHTLFLPATDSRKRKMEITDYYFDVEKPSI